MKQYFLALSAFLSVYTNADIDFKYTDMNDVPERYQKGKTFGEYHYIKESFGLSGRKGIVFYYKTGVRPELSKWYRKELKLSKLNKRKGRNYIPYAPLSERKIVYFDGKSESVFFEDKNVHLSKGPAQDDWWGCLHERPLFEIEWPVLKKDKLENLTSKDSDQDSGYAVLVTGAGNGRSTGGQGVSVSDSLYMNIIDHSGNVSVKEPMLNVSYSSYPLIDFELEDDFFYTDAGIPRGSNPEDLLPEDNQDMVAGRKGYGKLFGQDFNDNGQQDLVFWHRIYKSHRAVKDPKTKEWDTSKRRFEFEREWFTWYEENPERNSFIKRELSVEQGKQWLTENQLGWNDGFPKDNSQCEIPSVRKIPMMTNVYDPELKPYQR